MRRIALVVTLTTALLAVTAVAHAAELSAGVVAEDALAALGLAGAVVLLVLAVLLQRIAVGSAMADNISYVVAGAVCIGGSALANWSTRFAPDAATAIQIGLAADGLLLVAIVLLCVYFFRVRSALQRFQRIMTSVEPLAEMHVENRDVPHNA